MKLFLNAKGETLNEEIDPRFGRCNFFLLYETEDDSHEFIGNIHQDDQTSVGVAVAEAAIELGAGAVISVNTGPRAFKILKDAGVSIYHVNEGLKLKQAIISFSKNELKPLEAYMPRQE